MAEINQCNGTTTAEQESSVSSFYHSGFRIYLYKIRTNSTIETVWSVQSIENRERELTGERQIGGDSLWVTKEQAMGEATRQAQRAASDDAWREELAEEESEAAKAELARIAMFADFVAYKGYSAPSAEKARRTLEKPVSWNGRETTLKMFVEELISDGRFIGDDDGRRGLEHPDGRFLREKAIGKIGMDYAEYLLMTKQ
jgi:hypothetical protein